MFPVEPTLPVEAGSDRATGPRLCQFSDRHRDGVIRLIDTVYGEFDDAICLENADRDLLDIPATYLSAGGEFVVLEWNAQVLGCHAALPLDAPRGVCTFRRLYLDRSWRRNGWGYQLMRWAIDWATTKQFRRIEFWSDTRFARAHAFFERLGFGRDGRVRSMHDGRVPYQEYFFWMELT